MFETTPRPPTTVHMGNPTAITLFTSAQTNQLHISATGFYWLTKQRGGASLEAVSSFQGWYFALVVRQWLTYSTMTISFGLYCLFEPHLWPFCITVIGPSGSFYSVMFSPENKIVLHMKLCFYMTNCWYAESYRVCMHMCKHINYCYVKQLPV